MAPVPSPRATLAGCMWLPRIIAKARLLNEGKLPPEYEARFCHPGGVDGQFLAYFGLTREDIVSAERLTDLEIGTWIHGWAAQRDLSIDAWNHIAVNLGRPGFPMAERLPIALATAYAHLDPQKIQTVFEALEADEAVMTQTGFPTHFCTIPKASPT